MNLHSWSLRAAAVGVLLAGSSSAALLAEENFFQGKTITIIVGFEAGGGYDAYARLVADHLGKHIPGNPTIIIENMPGGGGRKSIIYVGSAAPKDGTVISVVPSAIAFDSVQSDLPDRLDAATFNYIGRLDSIVGAEVHLAHVRDQDDRRCQAARDDAGEQRHRFQFELHSTHAERHDRDEVQGRRGV